MNVAISNSRTPGQLRVAASVFFFVSGFGYSSWASRIPSIQQHLHMNEAQLGAVLFAMPAGLMLTMPITSRLLGRFNSRVIMLTGALIFNLLLSLPGFVVNTMQLVIVLFCFGSARNLLNLAMNTQAVGVQEFYDKSILTTLHGIWSLAGFAGAGVGYLMLLFEVATPWHLLSVSLFLVALSIYFFPGYTLPTACCKNQRTRV